MPTVLPTALPTLLLTLLGAAVLLLLLLLALAGARWWSTRALEDVLDGDDEQSDRRSLLPDGHQPPPGLSPLSPSERFLAAEATRGLRDLQLFLHDAA